MNRRNFMKLLGTAAGSLVLPRLPRSTRLPQSSFRVIDPPALPYLTIKNLEFEANLLKSLGKYKIPDPYTIVCDATHLDRFKKIAPSFNIVTYQKRNGGKNERK